MHGKTHVCDYTKLFCTKHGDAYESGMCVVAINVRSTS
jgi:hypothetical protein